MKDSNYYDAKLTSSEWDRIQFIFASTGSTTIIKTIEYSPITVIEGTVIYNLGFGDFDEATGTLFDDVDSNNGDMYTVFNTVLHTVPIFFQTISDCAIVVSGSDSHDEFEEKCRSKCERRKCLNNNICKKKDQRIKTYRYYIDKNFESLSEEYLFYGKNKSDSSFSEYVPFVEYDDILVYKKD